MQDASRFHSVEVPIELVYGCLNTIWQHAILRTGSLRMLKM